ncbi:MAG: Rieske (2Fe-2S) protein, partial [Burkholderiales bacterium]
MSNLANADALLHTTPQLPVSWYFDPAVLALEQKHLFEKSPTYIGHELMVLNPGDFYSLEWMDDAKALVHNQQGISLLSNVCRHRQAIMLKGSGTTQNIVCPLHRWTYNLDGRLLGAPHFPGNPCLDLGS